ncbi:hypothetical protein SUTMEG_13770 [Sutterella megalosphaeroides]|uniref:Conjugal transfer protein TraF n=1 Tax=Sutterella megalosphaeroides TaxID=2494234 RepID=A0A2Z6IFI7_9BURK|nr:hypothetical protein SUTMEG_13770 [Sutterella megalosphaeroides]
MLLASLAGLFACASALSPVSSAGAAPATTFSTTPSTAPAGVLAFPAVTAGADGAAGADIAGSASSAAASQDRSRSDWWTEDVWQDPDRPFLFYGNPDEEEKAARRRKARTEENDEKARREVREEHEEPKAPTFEQLEHVAESAPRKEDARKAATPSNASPLNDPDLTTFTTVKGLRAEVERRLERALMDPTPEHVSAYLEANAFILGKAHRFQVAWERTRFAHPQYDWTASHPVANFATAEENERVMREKSVFLKSLGEEAGILFVVRADDPLSELAARSLSSFARTNGIEVLVASDRPVTYAGLPPSKPYNALVASLGLTRLPAAVLVPNPATVAAGALRHPALQANPRPTLFATGVVSVEELGSRLMLLLAPPATEATDAVAATRNGRALTTGEAWEAWKKQEKSAGSTGAVVEGTPASARLNASETLAAQDFASSRAAHEGMAGEASRASSNVASDEASHAASHELFPREERAR